MYILCTNGTPSVDTLDHLPPLLPLFLNYRDTDVTISGQDELGISHALRLRDRVRYIDLHLPPSILNKFLLLMDGPFPSLEHLSLSSETDNMSTLTLPKTFLAPKLCYLALNIHPPKRLQLLSFTASLVRLVLENIRTSTYFLPRILVTRLQLLPHLEQLTIGFSIPIPRPSVERRLFDKQGAPVTLPNLKLLTFQGVSAYLECLVAQIRAPLLEQLDITFFNQIVFALPHLSHLVNVTERLKLPAAKVFFENDGVSITTADHGMPWSDGCFLLLVKCKQLDWQIDCAAQICSALMPGLSDVEALTLDFHEQIMPTEWQNGEIDGTTWHDLLRSFIRVKMLRIVDSLSGELSRALRMDEIGSDPGLLPDLRELESEFNVVFVTGLFGSFIDARRVAGRPVRPAFTSFLPLRTYY
jgi:hypothetical protein